MYIRRAMEDVILRADKTFKATLITGARQTGKFTVLEALFPDRRSVTFDDAYLEEQAKRNPDMFLQINHPPVTLDEVQYVPELFRYIKMVCDASRERGLFTLSGSQPLLLMKHAAESLSGRVCVLEMLGLSLREIQGDPFSEPFLPIMDYILARQKTVKKPENIWEIIHRGSYPELYHTPEMDWQSFYSSYVKTYLERDVRSLTAVQDLDSFRRFMVAVAARTGQMLNYSNIADEISRDVGTVKNWMSILEASGIVYLLEPYTPAVLKRAIKTPKVYFRDTGLASYLTRWLTTETLAFGAMSGAMFETYAVSEILKSYANRNIDYRYCVSYYRGKDKQKKKENGQTVEIESEIDLIIEENGVLYPVEIKTNTAESASAAGSFTVLDKVPEKKRGTGAVVNLCPQPGRLRENVLEIPVWYI
ncbi:MAG: ATP-binding protein [Clostridia bacterium]|nr:ATP-binding protein [Clostridia bacterium]